MKNLTNINNLGDNGIIDESEEFGTRVRKANHFYEAFLQSLGLGHTTWSSAESTLPSYVGGRKKSSNRRYSV